MSIISRVTQGEARPAVVSTQDLKQIDSNLRSIRDFRRGRSTQLQMSGRYTYEFLSRSQSQT